MTSQRFTALAALALAGVSTQAWAQEVGATVTGNDGLAIGTVLSNDGTTVVVDTGTHQVPLGPESFAMGEGGPTLNTTRTQLDEAYAALLAEQQAALEARLVVGAEVVTADAQSLGTIDMIDGENIVIERGEQKVTFTRNYFALSPEGSLMVLANLADIEAAIAQQGG